MATNTYNAANWLTQVNNQTYSYDANGNLLNDGLFTYDYDSANRLTGLTSLTDTVSYVYNGDGVRVAQIENGLRTDYVQDVAAALPQVLLAQQGGTVSKYLRGLGLIGEQTGGTGPNAAPAVWQYHLPDALGSVRQIADPTGQLLLTQRFDPFGGLVERSTLNVQTAYGFAGEEQDPTTGQLFLRARTYNPSTGRFLQSDPVLGTPNDPRTLHHYAYAFNNPVNYSDPSGLWVGTREQPRGQAQPQNSKLQALINSYTAPLQTQLAYAGNLGKNGFNRSHLGAAGNLGSQGAQRSSIGQEGQFWQNQSDPEPRDQSQGHRQGPCGIGSLLVGIRDAGRAVMDTTQKIGSELEQDWTNHWNNCHGFDCGPYLPNSPTLNKVGREVKNFVLENPDVIIGMIPVIGDLYDAMSGLAGVDLLTGRTLSKAEWGLALGAGLLGLFTGADELVDGLALLGRAANKLSPAKLVGKGLDIVDKGFGALKTGAKALREIGQVGLSQVDELAQTVSRFGRNAGQVADEVAAAAVDVGRGASHLDEGGSLTRSLDNFDADCGNSFTAGTPVETDKGQKPIEEIKIGDKVLAEDPETGEQGYFEVVALTNHPTDEILQVMVEAETEAEDSHSDEITTLDPDDDSDDNKVSDNGASNKTEVMEVTPDHPVYVEGKGWIWAENLAIGDRLRRVDGGWAKVLAVERIKLTEPKLVYNLTVKGPHTYFILEVGVLVHNTSCVWYPGAGKGTGRWRDKDGFISFDEARNRVELPGEAVDIHKISAGSNIPERFFEPVQEIARKHQVVCGFRDCNKNLGNFLRIEIDESGRPILRGDFWPKDTNVPIFNGVDSKFESWLKASSAVEPTFKTSPQGLVSVTLNETNFGIVRRPNGIFELEPMEEILKRRTINEDGKFIFDLSEGIPMGPDVDTYFFLKRTDTGFVNLGTDTPEELLLRWQIGRQMSYEIPGVGSMSLIGHGTAQPHFSYTWSPNPERYGSTKESWGDAFIVMDDGQFRIVPDQQIEAFSRYLNPDLTTYRKGPGPLPGHGVSKLKDPWLPPGYPPLPDTWLAH